MTSPARIVSKREAEEIGQIVTDPDGRSLCLPQIPRLLASHAALAKRLMDVLPIAKRASEHLALFDDDYDAIEAAAAALEEWGRG